MNKFTNTLKILFLIFAIATSLISSFTYCVTKNTTEATYWLVWTVFFTLMIVLYEVIGKQTKKDKYHLRSIIKGKPSPKIKEVVDSLTPEVMEEARKELEYNAFDEEINKPKFKVGDWITSDVAHDDYRTCRVVKIDVEYGRYVIESIYGYIGYNDYNIFDSMYRLWTIQDATKGDVLYSKAEDGVEYIVMLKNINKAKNINSYCRYNSVSGFDVNVYAVLNYVYDKISPATIIQRNLLFQKMKEACYEWDSDKLELKKLETINKQEGETEWDGSEIAPPVDSDVCG